jgi:hypothetical protein
MEVHGRFRREREGRAIKNNNSHFIKKWHQDREKRTIIARTKPLPLNSSKETRLEFILSSGLTHISAVMGPLSVWSMRFFRSVSGAMPGDGGGGDKERSKMNCPSTAITGWGPRFDTWT